MMPKTSRDEIGNKAIPQIKICQNYFHQQMHPYIKNIICQNVQLKYLYVCSYMFRFNWTILTELMLSLAKATILWN